MTTRNGQFDAYVWRARIAPCAVVASPLLVLALFSGIAVTSGLGIIGTILGLAVLALAAQFGRDSGRALQAQLWADWGGSPTQRRLRYSSPNQSQAAVDALHRDVSDVTDLKLPDAQEESADPASADAAYERATSALRELTRDHQRFRLVHAENVDYGFRRNLLGLRRWGILVAALTLAVCVVVALAADASAARKVAGLGIPLCWSLGTLVLFLYICPDWVRIPADAYADRLLGAVDVLRNR